MPAARFARDAAEYRPARPVQLTLLDGSLDGGEETTR
jgi:hypothetical protein